MPSKSGEAPKGPDPSQVIGQQTKSNVDTAVADSYLNRINQYTTQGSKTYQQRGTQNVNGVDVPLWDEYTRLSPEQQKLYDTQTRVTQGAYDLADKYTGRIADATSKPYNYDGLPGAPTYNEDYRKQQLGAIEQRNQPQMDRDRANLEQRLADQGVGLQDPAYRTAMDQYQRGVNDFHLGADVQAGNAAAQQYGLEASTRDRAIQEMTNQRTQPINEVAALLGTGQGVQNPQFGAVPQVQVAPTDVTGAYGMQYQGQMAQYQAAQKSQQGMMGGLFGLGAAGIGAAGMII